jgi:hypothetical protein
MSIGTMVAPVYWMIQELIKNDDMKAIIISIITSCVVVFTMCCAMCYCCGMVYDREQRQKCEA